LSLLFLNFTSFSQKRDPFLEEQGVYVQSRWTLSDTVRVIKIINKAKKIAYLESNRSEKLYRTALHISKQIETDEWTVRALLGISTAKIYQNERDSALYYADKAKPIAKRTGMPELTIGCIDQEAVIYSYLEQYDKATDLSFEAIKAAEKISPKYAKRSYGTLGYAFMKLGDLKKSSTYSTKAYELAKKYNDTSLMLSALNVIALNYKNTDKLDEAIASFEEGLELSRASNNIQRESQILYNLANIFFIQGEDLKGLQYFEESVEMSKPNATFEENAYSFHALAYANSQIGNFKTAHKFADSALSYALLSKSYELITEAYAINAQVYWELGDSENAFACLTRAYAYKDSMNIAQLRDAAILSESDFEKEKKRLEDSLKTEQQRLELANEKRMSAQKLKSRDQLIWIFAIALILLLIAGYFILKNNRLIKIQNALVNRQKEEIQEQHNEIRDSIDYAKRIQQAMINKQSEWDAIGQHYILFKPKDVVSGDFYWAFHKKNLAIWVVADCTGHGVPGAFMSMLGFGFLNEIVVERDCSDAAEILNLLRAKIVSALRGKGENQARDGMDISVCIWDKTKQTLQYAGANNPLWLIRHRSTELPEHTKRTTQIEDSALQLLEIEPDKMPVGFVDVNAKPFANKSIQLFEGDVIVQLTDGFADQFGGPHGKKLKYAAMKRALLEFQSKSFEQQEKALDTLFESWKGDLEQVDDVCVVAVKVS
jgi:serine phosphatase RsbU (regulator of sigma subunit)